MICSVSCKKETKTTNPASPTPTGYFVKVSVNSTEYSTSTICGSSYSNQSGCDAFMYNYTEMCQFIPSAFSFSPYIVYRQNKAAFDSLSTGTYDVSINAYMPFVNDSICNWDLAVIYRDKTQPDQTCTLEPNGVHNVTSITYKSETSTKVEYSVEGNFDFNVKNSANAIIHITGTYRIPIEPIK